MLPILVFPIKPSVRVVPLFGHLTCGLSAISGIGGRFGPAFGLIDIRLGRSMYGRKDAVEQIATDGDLGELEFDGAAWRTTLAPILISRLSLSHPNSALVTT